MLRSVPRTYRGPQVSSALQQRIDRFEDRLPELMHDNHVPGVSLALIENRKLVWSRGYGVRCAGTRHLVQPDTVMEACSMSKPFYAYLFLKMVEQKTADLNRPLVEYFGADYIADDPRHRHITAKMVLTHTSGLPNWRQGGWRAGGPLSLASEPGKEFRYSGEGFFLLQRAIEKHGGTDLDSSARDRLIKPLQLENTRYVWDESLMVNAACGHDDEGKLKADRIYYDRANAAFSLYTTSEDYARFIVEILKEDRSPEHSISSEMRSKMLTPITHREERDADWGLGWGMRNLPNRKQVYHSGSNRSGFRCYSEFYPDTGDGMVIMTNAVNGKKLWQTAIDDWHAEGDR